MGDRKAAVLAVVMLGTVFFIPSVLHFTVNFHWWLFDGNKLIVDKMFASGITAFVSGFVIAMIYDISIKDSL